MKANDTTHFGYQSVTTQEKEQRVAEVFKSVATRYDVMNDIMTGGLHRLWKRFTIEISGVRKGHKVLDLAGGTGDLAMRYARFVGPEGEVVLADINESMLQVGRDRAIEAGFNDNITYIQANAEDLPFADNTFDCITIAFGLRDITDKQKALDSISRALKPGGRLLVLEFSKPKGKLLNKLYDTYSFKVMPTLGKLVAGNHKAYRYMAESIRMHPDQKTIKGMMQKASFRRVEFYNLSGGIVAVHRGFKP